MQAGEISTVIPFWSRSFLLYQSTFPWWKTGLQNWPSSGATTARHRGVVTVKECIKRCYLAARGPPGEDFELVSAASTNLRAKKLEGVNLDGPPSSERKNLAKSSKAVLEPGLGRRRLTARWIGSQNCFDVCLILLCRGFALSGDRVLEF
jgi:hypothetical protein